MIFLLPFVKSFCNLVPVPAQEDTRQPCQAESQRSPDFKTYEPPVGSR